MPWSLGHSPTPGLRARGELRATVSGLPLPRSLGQFPAIKAWKWVNSLFKVWLPCHGIGTLSFFLDAAPKGTNALNTMSGIVSQFIASTRAWRPPRINFLGLLPVVSQGRMQLLWPQIRNSWAGAAGSCDNGHLSIGAGSDLSVLCQHTPSIGQTDGRLFYFIPY